MTNGHCIDLPKQIYKSFLRSVGHFVHIYVNNIVIKNDTENHFFGDRFRLLIFDY